jgi:hypothetical protein
VSLEEALARAGEFAEAGADVLFIDALESVAEMQQFCSLRGVASGTAKMASLLEGGGKTPMVATGTLQQAGFKLVAYPLSLLGVSVKAMQNALQVRCGLSAELFSFSASVPSWQGQAIPECRCLPTRWECALVDTHMNAQVIKQGSVPDESAMPSFSELQQVLGFPQYFAEARRYSTAIPEEEAPPSPAAGAAAACKSDGSGVEQELRRRGAAADTEDVAGGDVGDQGGAVAAMEADAIFEEGDQGAADAAKWGRQSTSHGVCSHM